MFHVFIQASLCLFWHIFEFGNKPSLLQVFHLFFDLFQCCTGLSWAELAQLEPTHCLFADSLSVRSGSAEIYSFHLELSAKYLPVANTFLWRSIFCFIPFYVSIRSLFSINLSVGNKRYLSDSNLTLI